MTDEVEDALVELARGLTFAALPAPAVLAAKARVLDTLGALLAGFDGDAARTARAAAWSSGGEPPAPVLGTGRTAPLEMAAFANATAARYAELNDVYFASHGGGGHPSDVVTPVLAAAQAVRASGRDLIAAVTLAYEVYTWLIDGYKIEAAGFDHTNYAMVAAALAAGRLFGLSRPQLTSCVSIAATTGVALRQARSDALTMWKAVASGNAGRTAMVAATLARHGIEGPSWPFAGACGWGPVLAGTADPVLRPRDRTSYGVERTLIKPRAACMSTMSTALAAERLHTGAPMDPALVGEIRVEIYASARARSGVDPRHWHPVTREDADHSIPYVAVAALLDGAVGPAQFGPERVADPLVAELLARTTVLESPEFTGQNLADPARRPTRVSLIGTDGGRRVGEVSTLKGDLADPMSTADFEDKFLRFTAPVMAPERARALIALLWRLDELDDVTAIAAAMALDGQPGE